ncbi:MAG: hypothetical protein ACT4NY_30555 [Pseudonocardiales bacterium]
MSPSRTLEQVLLAPTLRHVEALPSGARLAALEAAAAAVGGFSIEKFWDLIGHSCAVPGLAVDAGRTIAKDLDNIPIPPSLALSALARPELSTHEQRRAGAYYTDFRLARFLADLALADLALADPGAPLVDLASGSGALLVAVVRAATAGDRFAATQMIAERVCAADTDPRALAGVRLALLAECGDLGVLDGLSGRLRTTDSLLAGPAAWADVAPAGFGLCIGNPPWEKTRLTRHEFLQATGLERHYGHDYDGAKPDEYAVARRAATAYGTRIVSLFDHHGGGDIDLYRLFTELALRSVAPGGRIALLLPAGLIRCLGTNELRRALLVGTRSLRLTVLDNKARFFGIDTRFKFLAVVGEVGPGPAQLVLRHARGTSVGVEEGAAVDLDVGALTDERGHVLVGEMRSQHDSDIFACLRRAGRLGTWRHRYLREVDMTNHRHAFLRVPVVGALPVVEGRMVSTHRFGAKAYLSGTGRAARWAPLPPGHSTVQPQFWLRRCDLPAPARERVDMARVGFCDITGQTNERTVIAAMLPAGVVAGNKVPTLHFDGDGSSRLAWSWLAVANSFTVDWFARRITTTSLNLFLLEQLALPPLAADDPVTAELARIAETLHARDGDPGVDPWELAELRVRADVLVARAFGLTAADLVRILDDFPLLDRGQPLLHGEPRSTITRDLVLWRYGDDGLGDRVTAARARGAVAYLPAEYTRL